MKLLVTKVKIIARDSSGLVNPTMRMPIINVPINHDNMAKITSFNCHGTKD
jgi:hypothetical protein